MSEHGVTGYKVGLRDRIFRYVAHLFLGGDAKRLRACILRGSISALVDAKCSLKKERAEYTDVNHIPLEVRGALQRDVRFTGGGEDISVLDMSEITTGRRIKFRPGVYLRMKYGKFKIISEYQYMSLLRLLISGRKINRDRFIAKYYR